MALSAAHNRLTHPYEEYVRSVSTPEMAVAGHAADLLAALCELRRPESILDLGSGFSTYVLGTHAAASGSRLVSIEDDEAWRAKTIAYLAHHDLEVDVRSLDGFPKGETFDLVFHDLGSMETRISYLRPALDVVAPGGLAVLDDMHKRHYRRSAVDVTVPKAGGTLLSARRLTLDHFGRWAALWLPLREAPRLRANAAPILGS